MVTIRTVAVHDVVAAVYPREVKEQDQIAMAIGKAIDATLNHLSHEARTRRAPGTVAVRAYGTEALDEALGVGALELAEPERTAAVEQLSAVADAFRRSGLLGLPRPRSRLILIGEAFGVYAQPDYWNGRDRFFEMKSYRAIPPHPDVALQVRLFYLAFPGFEGHLVAIDRHARPVTVTTAMIPRPSEEESAAALRAAVKVAQATGQERVLEYIDVPVVRYPFPVAESAPAPGGSLGGHAE
jgi:hypothetical protein